MTTWWQKAFHMPKYVTQEHFDAVIGAFRSDVNARFVDVNAKFDSVMTKMDAMTTILLRLDQERIFTLERIRRIEDDMTMVKKHLKLV